MYERNGIECSLTDAGCCGAPWLHAGDVKTFTKVAEKNVATLAAEIRAGKGDIVVPEPTCGYVLKKDYVDYVGAPLQDDAKLVAEHTYDAAEYLVKVHKTEGMAARHRLHRRGARARHVPHRLPPARPEHRVQEPRPDEAHRRQGEARPAVLGHRRDVGSARRERGRSRSRSPRSSPSRSSRPVAANPATSSPATAASPTPRSPSRPARTRRTRSR